jgi:isoleucyl-tRNA synthetase
MSEQFKQYEGKEVKKSPYAVREEEVLQSWEDNDVFKKTLEKKSTKGDFVFYEGPPTANGRPGIHHILSRSYKDAIPRYKTMQGYRVHRRAGWDTHGLPVELQVEKELGLTSKKEIEEYGIAEFNEKCKESVWTYRSEWEQMTRRMGYWVDMENPYVTYTNDYVETLWWVAKQIAGKDLLYKDYRVAPWCPRCGTGLSSHELAQGYADVKDISITAKFELVDEPGTFILAWTTTPWTLPGNVGLAVGTDIDYIKAKVGDEFVIVAKDLAEKVLKDVDYEIADTQTGETLIGKEYKPLFPYFKKMAEEQNIKNLENAYKVYAADFVTTTDGTGIVHTAVMYGQDDFELGNQVGLPKMHLVTEQGTFVDGMDQFSGRNVKEEIDGKPTLDIDVIKYLQEHNTFFAKEKYEHSYPHCWRCKTPLIYYARDSWYINMQSVKQKLIDENKDINWEPEHVREGRFGEWLNDVKDWAISRERYWGTPLPVWQAEDGEQMFVGSFDDIKQNVKKSGNQYFVMRHGEADHNVASIANSSNDNPSYLTELGKKQAKDSAQKLQDKNITKIYHSPLLRGKETAEIVARELGITPENVIEDDRLREYNYGDLEGKDFNEFRKWRDTVAQNLYTDKNSESGESYYDVKRRIGDLWYEVENKDSNENILFVAHGALLEVAPAIAEAASLDRAIEIFKESKNHGTGDVTKIDFVPLPHNENFELDPHRPYIDDVVLEKDGKEFYRVKEVMDVWFDSGCMPFAQEHYMGTGSFPYPADFICEGMDQTRGWFYTLHAIGNLLGKGKAYKNVIALGLVNDENGQKMSKSRGNTVNPWDAMNEFGVDTVRMWLYSVNAPGESKNFDPKTIIETQRKVFGLLDNSVKFYEMYANETKASPKDSSNVLDRWILAKLDELIADCTSPLDKYQLLEPTRAIRDFIADLSQWYIRRSRDRFKTDGEDKQFALATTQHVLLTLSRLLAPFTPFFAEDIYSRVGGKLESVHLESWPKVRSQGLFTKLFSKDSTTDVLEDMKLTRDVISQALELRASSTIKVRQPLGTLTITKELGKDYIELVKDEVNVKEVIVGEELYLDTTITSALKTEGDARELIRVIQSMRKKAGLNAEDEINLSIDTSDSGKKVVETFNDDIRSTAGITEFVFESNDGEEVTVNDLQFKLVIK